MIALDVEQGSTPWMDARLGIPTASCYDQLMTPKSMKPSTSRFGYRNRLLAEWLLGYAVDWGGNGWTERGQSMEAEARAWYEFERDVEVQAAGFVLRDDEQTGGSPDGLVGEDGGVEIKCPALHTHIGYLIGDDPDYAHQVQGYMYLTGRAWWDVVSYSPILPKSIVRVERDEEHIAAFTKILDDFIADLNRHKDRLAHYRRGEHKDTLVSALTASVGAS